MSVPNAVDMCPVFDPLRRSYYISTGYGVECCCVRLSLVDPLGDVRVAGGYNSLCMYASESVNKWTQAQAVGYVHMYVALLCRHSSSEKKNT